MEETMPAFFNFRPAFRPAKLNHDLGEECYLRANTIYKEYCTGYYDDYEQGKAIMRKTNFNAYAEAFTECLRLCQVGFNVHHYDLAELRYYQYLDEIFSDEELSKHEPFRQLKKEYLSNNKLILCLQKLCENSKKDGIVYKQAEKLLSKYKLDNTLNENMNHLQEVHLKK